MLSKRLKSLIKYIDKNDKLIDIGCDHGLIDIYLVKNKIINSIIISDIPYQNKHNLSFLSLLAINFYHIYLMKHCCFYKISIL